jgi:magnesium-transporting ATPase (P-type)
MDPRRIAGIPWHARTADEALADLESRADGLSAAEAAARLTTFGANELPKAKRRSLAIVFLGQFQNPLIYLLLAAAAVSLAIGETTDAGFIFAVLLVNAVIGTAQEWKAETSAEALKRLLPIQVVVRRDGDSRKIDGRTLVPGDVVRIASGTLVPADVRLLAEQDVKVDESLLTGESLPVGKDAAAVVADASALGDRRTMLHAGTMVLSGRAEGVVVRTGSHTEVGRIAQALAAAPEAPPPLVVRLERFTRMIGVFIVAAVTVLGVALYLTGMAPAAIFFLVVALAVSAIPEGLPVAITVALSVASARMARRNVIVRKLPAVEGLGACTVIASDKTGTLTLNALIIARVWLPEVGDLVVEGRGYAPEGAIRRVDGGGLDEVAAAALRRLAEAGALANEAALRVDADGGVRHLGDTVDVAFLALAGKLGLSRPALLQTRPELAAIPYESAQKFAAAINRHGDGAIASVKGAAEVVLPMCAGADPPAVLDEAHRLAADGFRVLAVAAGQVAPTAAEAPAAALAGLELLGLVGLIDPLRGEVPDAIRRCREAGIGVRMVTGDHPVTALAIARALGLAESETEVVHGADLHDLANDPSELDLAVARGRVFARVEPVQKLAIVESLGRGGHFVAVTGDGVNDAPALNAAHIGVAMGEGGTDVARGAADLILTDDNFASIVGGIEEGRIAYDNIRKVVYLLISTGAAELIVFFLAFAFGRPIPLFAVQLLWLNLVTNGFQQVAVSFEKGEPGILGLPPRSPDQPIFDRRMIEEVLLSGAFIGGVGFLFFDHLLRQGWSEADARNALLLWMVACENVHGFNCRSEWRSTFRIPLAANPILVLSVLAAHGVHIAAMYTPGLSEVLGAHPVSFATWSQIAGLALGLIAVMEVYKLVRPRPPR